MLNKLIQGIKDNQAKSHKQYKEAVQARAAVAKDIFEELVKDKDIRAEMVRPQHWVNQIIK